MLRKVEPHDKNIPEDICMFCHPAIPPPHNFFPERKAAAIIRDEGGKSVTHKGIYSTFKDYYAFPGICKLFYAADGLLDDWYIF